MDPLTHVMAGALIAHACAGLAVEPAATITAMGAAALPDFDFYARKYDGAKFLKVHHGATHSLLGVLVQSLGGATAAWAFFRFVPVAKQYPAAFLPLLVIAFLSVTTHVFLDWIMHNNGLPLLWPFSEKHFCVPLVLGVNPQTVSHNCGEKHYLTCFGCQSRGGVFNPIAWIVLIPAVLGFFAPAWRNFIGVIPWLLVTVYFCVCVFLREQARRAVLKVDPYMKSARSYPGRARPDQWLFVRRNGEKSYAALADGIKGCIMRRWEFRHEVHSLDTRQAVQRVINDLEPIITHMYMVEVPTESGKVIEFRDLSYLYAEPTEINTIRVVLDSDNHIQSEVYQEIW